MRGIQSKSAIVMKKLIMILAAAMFMLSGTILNAQVDMDRGVKGGLTVSNLYINANELDDENARFGFHVGLYSQMMFTEMVGWRPEVIFTTKGTSASYGGLIDQDIDFNLSYLEIPVMVIVNPIENISFHIGPYVGYMITSNVNYSGLVDAEDRIERDHFNTIDYGLGAGVEIHVGVVKAGLRYNLGLRQLADGTMAEAMLGDSKHAYSQLYIAFDIARRY